jgi:hypothetical protein
MTGGSHELLKELIANDGGVDALRRRDGGWLTVEGLAKQRAGRPLSQCAAETAAHGGEWRLLMGAGFAIIGSP